MDGSSAPPGLAGVDRSLAPRLTAGRAFFFMAGLGIFTWAIVAPFAKIKFTLDDGTLGLILLTGGLGGLVAMPLGSVLMARFGSRALLAGSSVLLGLLLPALVLAPSIPVFTGLMFTYGFVFGGVDIAMNAQAAAIESLSGGRQMSLFHAFFSIGGLVVALATAALLRAGASDLVCGGVAGLVVLLIVPQARHLLPPGVEPPATGRRFALPDRATTVLGLCCFTCFLTEGAATDWSTIFLRFSRGMPLASAGLGYAAFAVMMAASRLGGDRVVAWAGPATVMRLGCGLTILGLVLAIALPYGVTGIFGFGLVGLGTGNIAPLVFSAASRVPGVPPSRAVPAVVGLGYAGFLTGPVVIGLVAHRFSLSAAYGLDAALVFATLFMARAVAI